MANLKGWQKIELQNNQNYLEKIIVFTNFIEAFGFISKLAILAEKMNHHPTIICTYNKVTLQLNTHDANYTITSKDLTLSNEIDILL